MDNLDWIFNGLRPYWIQSMDDSSFPQITLHCAAYYEDSRYETPLDEIKAFKEMACLKITNEITESGGSDLQASIDGPIIPISDGIDNWLGALYYPKYGPDEFAMELIEFDLIFELQLVNKEVIPDPLTTPDTTKPYNLITQGYTYLINTVGTATQYLGTFTFNWDGIGRVYVASDWQADPATDLINIDDQLIVSNADGNSFERSCNAGNHYAPGPDIEVTSLLHEGINELTFTIKDIYGGKIGCGYLFLIQVND
ncbi:hypothetical protein [Methanobacterium spitsbergense]|uniref:Uncharacterized protein n=1 Tax=Methanobacterium spitsbergense TaxID=2874285 RepID=A0A8T5V347_9EURY|nr:hypothetical protein [Methanobacterium spitsbergense]MBZ2166291.1 hypothetical protein [Methanobacterium spitsbergense]